VLAQRRSSRLLVAVATASATLLALLAVAASPAEAKVKAPTGLSPHSAVSSSTPTFTWSRVAGASQYTVEVTSDATSQDVVFTNTFNNRFVPTTNLPDGDYTWRVKAIAADNTSSAWATAHMTVNPTAAPSPTSPVGDQHLSQPDAPALLRWSAVTGAQGYEIQVDNSGSWTNPTTYSAKGTSYFVDTPQAPGEWFWRVHAIRGPGLVTAWSSTASYIVDPLPDPEAGADMNTGTPVQDVSIDWLPVPGAQLYELEVGLDPDFNNLLDDVFVRGTTFAPGTTYGNDQYYWRVRAIDAGQNKMPWTTATPFTFQRNWPQKPTLQYPPDQVVPAINDPMFYQWTPVRHATRYQIDVSADPNFSPASINTCFTTGTTFSPMEFSPSNTTFCGPQGQGGTTYWRVRAIDDPRGVFGIFSAIHKYAYDSGPLTALGAPGAVVQTAPADGATVDVPTLHWNAVRDTQSYQVVLRDKNLNVVTTVQTPSTSWTPESKLPVEGNPYSWTVQSTDASGSVSPLYAGRFFSVSGNSPTSGQAPLTPITGVIGDTATEDFPSLSWVPMPGADYYRVRIGVVGSSGIDNENTSHINLTSYPYTAATDTGLHYLNAGDYKWFVQAYTNSSNVPIGTGTLGQFTVKDLNDASGQRVALSGTDAVSGNACDKALSNVDTNSQICTGVPATPVLSWNPVPHAAGYLLYLANDRELTNAVSTVNPYAVTTNTVWRPPSDLPDNTAQNSYYWYVRPCKSLSPLLGCTADPASTNAAATNAFRKASPAVQLQTPADGASLAGDPTFTWSDYYDTNVGNGTTTGIKYAGGAYTSYQTARSYHLQIATSPTFSQNLVVDDRDVDQPFYSPSDRTLPQGLLYWRVQVTDPVTNRLTWSPVRSFSNDLPAIDLVNGADTAPTIGATVGGAAPFRWTAIDGASQYQIQVYRNNDATHSDANLVINSTTRVPAFVSQNYLPTSDSDYRWRVRWFDSDGQPRPWSTDAHFGVKASTVLLNSPADKTFQLNKGVYFSWDAAPFAANYLLEARDANGGVAYSLTTAATANAPSLFNDGAYDWRVRALDPNNNPIATSAWRHFTVDSLAPVVTALSPSSIGKTTSKVKLTFNEKVLGLSGSSFTLHMKGRSSKLPAKVTLASNKKVATLTPRAHLKKGKLYTVKVSSNVHDAAGNHMALLTWSFSV
jgi:hypothetical protein